MKNLDRRAFLESITKPIALTSIAALNPSLSAKVLKKMNLNDKKPHQVARDESFWREIQQGYTADRGIVNLNNGGVSPSPSVVQNAMKRHLDFKHGIQTSDSSETQSLASSNCAVMCVN